MRLSEYFKAYARGRGIGMAEELQREMRKLLNVQAPLRRTKSGRLVAATPAKPFAIPRKVTGKLRNSVKVIRTTKGASVQVYAPYGAYLEYSRRWYGWPHRFISIAMDNLGLVSQGKAFLRGLKEAFFG